MPSKSRSLSTLSISIPSLAVEAAQIATPPECAIPIESPSGPSGFPSGPPSSTSSAARPRAQATTVLAIILPAAYSARLRSRVMEARRSLSASPKSATAPW